MKTLVYYFVFFYNLYCLSGAVAQNQPQYQLFLKNGTITPDKNISEETLRKHNLRTMTATEKSLVVIQFEAIPDDAEKEQLKQEGIELLDYIPNNAYLATIKGSLNAQSLRRSNARAMITLSPEQKMQPALSNGMFPSHAEKVKGMLDVWISFPKSFTYDEVRAGLTGRDYTIISDKFKNYEILELRIAKERLSELASLPFVKFVEAVPGEDKEFNDKSEANSTANILGSGLPGGYGLLGKGVVVGVGDDSNPARHIDLNNRFINRAAIQGGSHGLHVMGTLAGGGIIGEKYKGYAPKATIVTQYFSNIFTNAANYVKDFGMVITNNSYGINPTACADFGEYTLYSYILDQQSFEMPYLQHVFASGNSGNTEIVCADKPGTVLSGYQTAKNVITVGNTTTLGVKAANSSKGPVKDGRTKPEIMAQGSSVTSSLPIDKYGPISGTSMAAPAVSGGLALLYQRYRDRNDGSNPKNGLMKALLCNGAYDLGDAGPDYNYGFGWLNLLRSIKMLDNTNYLTDVIANSASKTHTVVVPSNTAQLKIMLYWNDPGASVLTGKALVNNLDVSVTPPGGSSTPVLPRLHNTTDRSTGIDDLNNMEQVVIDDPAAGNYTISVKGKTIPKGNQEYFIVYDNIPVSTNLTFPIGNERLVKGDQVNINWESFGNTASLFKVEFSTGNGNAWTPLAESVAANIRQLQWTVPDFTTDQARIRITQLSTGAISESQPFTILDAPTLSLSSVQCEGYINMDWTPVSGSTDYEILILKGEEMTHVGFTTSTSYAIGGLSADSVYYVSVRARLNEHPGRRAMAKSRTPNDGNCEGSISNNDLTLAAILSPEKSGRKSTSTELTSAKQITIRIKNLDDNPSSEQIEVGYSIGAEGSTVYRHNISPAIPAGGFIDYTFPETANLAGVGSYRLKVFVNKAGDPNTNNNTVVRIFKQLANPAVTIPFLDQAEELENQEIIADQTGLAGGDRYDFTHSTPIGRLRTFVNTGMAFSGTRAYTLDVSRYDAAGNSNFFIGTYNLSAYNAATYKISLSFRYKNHGQTNHPDNKVWIRGSDTDPWIEAYSLFNNQLANTEGYKLTGSIAISDILNSNGQNFSSSFQIKWGQWGNMITADNLSGGGYSFDDIKLFTETDDLRLVSIDNPSKLSCGFNVGEQIAATIANNASNALTNIPIKLQIDGGSIITETISSISAGGSIQYKFSSLTNALTSGSHVIKVWVNLGTDSNPNNNTQQLTFYNSQVISSFPYLENFESSNGFWRSEGINSSWAYGTPAATKINKAASGVKAWKTSLEGNYNDNEKSYLYSPCFRIAELANPALSFSTAMDIQDCDNGICDIAFVEYSTDGNTWNRLGAKDAGTNWYDEINNNQGTWSAADNTRWHVSTSLIPKGLTDIRFRFGFQADNQTTREGIAIDDIHIYDLHDRIFSGSASSAVIRRPAVSGTNWIHFTDNGKIVASIRPDGNDLGDTEVQANINQSSVRNHDGQYYLDRNFTIKPQNNNFTKNSTVRLYFQETEFERLLTATGCNNCAIPNTAFELAVSKYSSTDKEVEDHNIANDSPEGWSFFSSTDVVKVPYDNGYYAEFNLQSFSEFWLAKEPIQVDAGALPVELFNFTAKKTESTDARSHVLLEWQTASEKLFSHFDIEMALGETAVRTGQFSKIGEVTGKGDSESELKYAFIDPQFPGSLTRYYRLKMVDLDGSFEYSTIRNITFDETIAWRVYPNPTTSLVNLEFQTRQNQNIVINIFDPSGRHIKKTTIPHKEESQTIKIDLPPLQFVQGLYLFEIISGPERQVFKVLRH